MKLELITGWNDSKAEQVGNKAHTLFRLQHEGFRVPKTLALPARFLAGIDGTKQWQEEWTSEIFATLDCEQIAVRSSGVDEDGSGQSFAGQFESVLQVTPSTFKGALEKVWESRQSHRSQAYRSHHELDDSSGFAIILQEMVPADVAGVAFSMDPVSGDKNTQVINAVQGLGDRLVAGEVSGEHIEIRNEKIEKAKLLSYGQLKQLSNQLKRLEMVFDSPQDVEFAFVGETLYILQARPITTQSDDDAQAIIWDNSNIIESFPGLTSPLTFSFIITVYEKAYRQLLGLLGASSSDMEQNREVFANTLGLIHGRVYYNLYAWYKMLSLLPGYSLNKDFMEKMMGVKESFELKDYQPMSGLLAWWRILGAARKILWNFFTLGSMRRQFLKDFQRELDQINTLDFEAKSLAEMRDLFRSFEDRIISKWKAPLVNDFFTMILFGVLQKMLEKRGLEHLHNDLLIGSRDIVSVQPALRIQELVELIQQSEALQKRFENSEKELSVKQLAVEHPAFHQALQDYIRDFGNRCGEELKLETVTYETDPEKLIGVLRGHLKANRSIKPIDQKATRAEAEQKAIKAFKRKGLFKYVLRKTRELVSNRENLRYERTKAFAIGRRIFRSIGQKLSEQGHIDALEDVFYLQKSEVFDFIDGQELPLRELVAERKEEYAQFKTEHLPERITEVNGQYELETPAEISPDAELKGIGCCPGVVRGEALLLHSPDSEVDLNGKVLLAQSTDPGWVSLFASTQGIVVERGSLLSHSAIVAREMGVPCVVNIPGLFQRIQNGDLIEMNGRTGTVRILENA